jgi:Flp pilus assembly protein TadG
MKRLRGIFGRRALRDSAGSEIAEMAMVMPVMFLVFLGIFWAGRMYNIYSTINQAARQGARVAAQSTCGSCGDASGTDAAVDTAVSNSIQADRLNPLSITAPNPVPSPNGCNGALAVCTSTTHNISVCRNALLTPTTVTPPVCGVLVEFTYQMDLGQITIPFAGGAGTLPSPQIAARAQMGVEQ